MEIAIQSIDELEQLLARLRKMSDDQLVREHNAPIVRGMSCEKLA